MTKASAKVSGKGKSSKASAKRAKGSVKSARSAKGKASAKGKGKAVATQRVTPLLTKRHAALLTVLAKSKRPITRNDMREATGIQKGFSALLGTETDNPHDNSLMARKLVSCDRVEGERSIMYTITSAGRQLLEKHTKAQRGK